MSILRSPRSLVLPVVAALGLLPATTAIADTTAGTAATAPEIPWGACTGLPVSTAGLDCGKLTVPLDYGNPSAGTVDVALIRAKATGTRIGSLVMNFGGGGNGVINLAASHQCPSAASSATSTPRCIPSGSAGWFWTAG
ncbi:hypothetical protein IMZ11_40605 [Microtetraspora sp. AC03309]|uniref:hypothetical protein n=1 Tax=Microtetraspora sp. AC03309 TaxID=2779376 RepID=UPI001E4317E1|nr:hypothetical protein [Microtetraspora sp. AC03309]MCC5581922.1 hypothetical protein [Microtetraspora sp. AC03309]